jgi:NADH:ubiquinone oxidoreductase subunit 5 (subunit L)/multisubunit Na+/H+ antiporter MnhA subunit
MELSTLLQSGDLLRDHPQYMAILILVLIGAFTKSAQAPFHFWLPNAMEAPTPVSAYLHSATMVKAGVYLLARVNPGLGGTEVWQVILVCFGAVTFLIGAILALKNTDLKFMLAQTTVASLGLLAFLIGLGHELALEAAMADLLAHALFKGALFMVAGYFLPCCGNWVIPAAGRLLTHARGDESGHAGCWVHAAGSRSSLQEPRSRRVGVNGHYFSDDYSPDRRSSSWTRGVPRRGADVVQNKRRCAGR